METIGSRLKLIRKNEKLTQTDFATRVLVSASYISKVESGKEIPSDIFIKLVALEFKTSYEWLKDGKGEMQIHETTYDYFERNTYALPETFSKNISALNEHIKVLLQSNRVFREICLDEICVDVLDILKLEMLDNEKDLLIEILSEYLANLEDLIERLNTVATGTNQDEKSTLIIASFVKSTEQIFQSLSDLLIKP